MTPWISATISFITFSFLPAYSQGEGPRAYLPASEDVTSLQVEGWFIEGNQSLGFGSARAGMDLDLSAGVLRFARTFAMGEVLFEPFLALPFGEVEGVFLPAFPRTYGRSSGFGDMQIGGFFGVYGATVLSGKEDTAGDPGLAVGLLTKLTGPTGDYSEDRLINLGDNRWSIQIGVPVAYCAETPFLDSGLTTFELLPSVHFFGDNPDPFRFGFARGDDLSQEPIIQVEAHITRNFNQMLWGAINATYLNGGETSVGGVSDGNRQEATTLGGTLGLDLRADLEIKASYSEVVTRNDNGPDGRLFQVSVRVTF